MRNALFTLLLAALVTVSLAVPNVFNYQGKLTTPDGVGINDDVDITINIYDGPDIVTATLLCSDALTDVPVVLGLFDIQYEVALDQSDLMGDLYMELIVDGNAFDPLIKLTTVPFALSAQYTDSAYYSVVAESLGTFTAADLMPNDLQGAYNEGGPGAGRRIDALNGPVDIRTAYTGPSDGRALELRTNDGVEPALYAYNSGAGPAIFCSGDLRMNGTIWSNADLRFQLDKNGDPTNNRFIVVNDTNATVFSVGEHGDATVLNEIDFNAALFRPQAVVPAGLAGKVYYDQTDNKLKWHDGSSWQDFGSGGVGTHSLQDAYDDGNAIVTTGGNAVSITAGTGTALYITSPDANGIWNDAGYWSPTGNISLGTGFYHTDNGLFQSNTDFIAKLDANDDEDASFIVRNFVDTDLFWVDEDGDVYVTGFLNVSNITNPDGDSIWIDEKLWVEELVTDTIESRGDVVFLKDAFGIRDSLWFDGEWRNTWPTGGTGGDFIWDQDTAAQDADFWIQGQGIFGGVTSYADADVQIGTGTSTSTFRPIAGYWRYHREVSRITPAEIGAGGSCTIEAISFDLGLLSPTDPWTYDEVYIWIEEVPSGTTLPSTWDPTSATQVYYELALVVPQVLGWVELDITDFSYDGTSDLFVYVQNGYQGTNYGSNAPGFRYTTVASGNYVNGSSDSSWPTTLSGATTRPNFLLSISGLPTVVDQVVVNSGNVDADGDITAGGDVSASSLTLDYTISAWPNWITKLDTLWAGDLGDVSDTIYAMDNFRINGELIVDSIQAVGTTIFLDDDIEVDGCATFGGGIVPMDTVFFEDFEAGLGGWSIADSSSSGEVWNTDNWGGVTPDPAADITGLFPIVDSDDAGSGVNVWSSLTSPDIDLSTYPEAQLMFGIYYRHLSSYGRVYVWDGAVWVLLHTYTTTTAGKASFDITPYLNAAFRVMFVYNDNNAWAWYWLVDNVTIIAPSGAAPPAVEICAGDITADGDIEGGTFTLDGVTITEWPSGGSGTVDLDTLWMPSGLTTDTMVAMAQFKVFGELIADSIQADGNIIYLDDSVNVAGALSLGADSTFRDDWEAQHVITVGYNNADFQLLDEAINAVSINGWTHAIIDVAPGIFPAGMLVIPRNVHLRGSGAGVTEILGQVQVNGILSRVKVTNGAPAILQGDVSHCSFDCPIIAGDAMGNTSISDCAFSGSGLIQMQEYGRMENCIVKVGVNGEGTWSINNCELFGRVSVQKMAAPITEFHITGCDFKNSLTITGDLVFVYLDASYFQFGVGAAVQVDENAFLEAKANHFIDCITGIYVANNASAVILSNDFTANMQYGVSAVSAFRVDVIGNSFVSKSFTQTAISLNMIADQAIIKDNVIEGCLADAVSLNTCPPNTPIVNNSIKNSIGNGIALQGVIAQVLRNTLINNGDGASSFDLIDMTPMGTVASYNVLDSYFPVGSGAFPGAFNTNTFGMIWAGIQTGQLP